MISIDRGVSVLHFGVVGESLVILQCSQNGFKVRIFRVLALRGAFSVTEMGAWKLFKLKKKISINRRDSALHFSVLKSSPMILQSSEIVFVSADFPGFSSAKRTFRGSNGGVEYFLKKFKTHQLIEENLVYISVCLKVCWQFFRRPKPRSEVRRNNEISLSAQFVWCRPKSMGTTHSISSKFAIWSDFLSACV